MDDKPAEPTVRSPLATPRSLMGRILTYLHWAIAAVGFCAMLAYSVDHDETSVKGFAAAYSVAMFVMYLARMIETWISYRRMMRGKG
ncbi:MAG: hypothetical protein JSS27_02405 [Planctomycetes bacterium]|nr:hypothetical protein [Planctomycetota bacterium]